MQHLLDDLVMDDWRAANPFSEDLRAAQDALLAADDAAAELILSDWLAAHQPCIFGKIAAGSGLLRYCFLRESDLADEEALMRKIQGARTAWKRDAWLGNAHGFLIVLLSQRVASAEPSPALLELARRLCSLYLLVDVEPDHIYLDELYYEFPLHGHPTRRWGVGVNYFCANADGRWWRDHRIPGGLAFSMNSVGHMAAVGKSNVRFDELAREFGLDSPSRPGDAKVRSLGRALVLAMQTIKNASLANSGKATELIDAVEDPRAQNLECPLALPQGLERFSHCSYRGWYHTDVSLPRPYFRPEAERPPEVSISELDFTYIFDERTQNPDFHTLGLGLQIREGAASANEVAEDLLRAALGGRFAGEEMSEEQVLELRKRLGIPPVS